MAFARSLSLAARQTTRPTPVTFARFSSTSSTARPASSTFTTLLTSRTTGVVASLASAGSIAWYAHLTTPGGLPSIGFENLPFVNRADALTPAEEGLHNVTYPFYHHGPLNTFDHAAIRRGYQVYREVCSSCHSLNRIAWRNLVGVSHAVDEVKTMAEEVEYEDGPDDDGKMFKRPGKLADYMPPPYENDNAARAANGGALPPDLSLMVKARHGGADYVFALLTGYPDEPPAGYEPPEGKAFNPYFPGVAIAMGRVLYDGLVEFEDGTPATTSQMAKDVVTFLSWAAEPEHDQRKLMGLQATIILSTLLGISVWYKRFKWAGLKSRRIAYQNQAGRH